MIPHSSTEGFIFKVRSRSEADRIFSVFTKETGRMEIFAKAVRKINSKLRGGAELFSVASLEFVQGRTKKTLTDSAGITRFRGITENPEKFMIATGMARIIDEFISGQEPDLNIFHFLSDIFGKLEHMQSTNLRLAMLYMYFFWNFMVLLGYHPEVKTCAHCHEALVSGDLYFSAADGGILCPSCARLKKDVVLLPVHAIKIVRFMLNKEWDMLMKIRVDAPIEKSLKEVSKIYHAYVLATHGNERNIER